MWVLLIIFLLMFLFLFLTKDFVNSYKLIMIFGKKGSGKTTFLTKTAINYVKKGYTVYSTIDIPGCITFDVQMIGKYTFKPESVVLIDEVGMIWDNRDFKNFRTDVRDFFKFQRQYKLRMYLFSQTFDIDLKLRNLTDEMYLLKNVLRVWSVARRIDKRITIQKSEEGKPGGLVDDYAFAPLLAPSSYIITFIPRWTSFFHSYAPKSLPIINGREIALNDVQTNNLTTSKWLKKSIVDFINNDRELFFKFKDRNKKID